MGLGERCNGLFVSLLELSEPRGFLLERILGLSESTLEGLFLSRERSELFLGFFRGLRAGGNEVFESPLFPIQELNPIFQPLQCRFPVAHRQGQGFFVHFTLRCQRPLQGAVL